jgi:small subunit ribosomal protein S24e
MHGIGLDGRSSANSSTGKQRKNRQKTLRGTAKVKGAKAKKDK